MIQHLRGNPVRRATVLSVLTGIGGQGTVLVSGILVARMLGVEDRGLLALLAVFPNLCSQIVGLGFPIAVTYQIAATPNQLPTIVKSAMKMFTIQLFVLLVLHGMIVWLFLRWNPDFQRTTAWVTLLVGPAMLALQYGVAFLQGSEKFQSLNILRLLLTTPYAVMVLGLYLMEWGNLHRVTIIWVFSTILVGLLALDLVRRLTNSGQELERPHAQLSQKWMFKFGVKGLIGATSPMETFRLDQLVAGLVLSSSALGLYVVGQAFGTLTHLVAQSASIVAYPTVVSRGKGQAGQATMWRFFWAVTLINGLVTVGLIALVPILIPLFFGQQFVGAIPVAQILLVGAALAASRRILVEGFRGLGKPQVSTIAEISMYPWLLSGGGILVWQYGLEGLAAAVAIGFFISLSVAIWFGWSLPKEAIIYSPRTGTEDALP